MMLRVNGVFLEFDADIEIERHVKLFEEIDATYGDYSYSFEIPRTNHNDATLGVQSPDISTKTVYNDTDCDVMDDSGAVIYSGKIRVDRVTKTFIECSFFSGNYNWFTLITGNVDDLDFSEYDTELEEGEIVNAMVNTEGITFPVIDTGALISRSYKNLRVEDFNGCMYLKTIFRKIFNKAGVKMQGELLNDFLFNNIVVCKNNRSEDDIQSRACYALKASTTTFSSAGTYVKLTFDDDSTFPYFDGDAGNFSLVNERYTADLKMLVQVEVLATFSTPNPVCQVALYKNGSLFKLSSQIISGSTKIVSSLMTLDASDYVEAFGVQLIGSGETCSAGTFKVTPIFIYNVKGNATVPNWTKQDFVSNVLNLFNVVTDFNPFTRTVTFNLFDKIKSKTPIDISEYVEVAEVDYSEFISGFSKQNLFSYAEGSDEELRAYNVRKFIKYGAGKIQVDNDFVQESGDVIQSDFKSPISYYNGAFDASLERVNFFELEEGDELDITSVTDASGNARLVCSNNFERLDLVRITESTVEDYNGDWVINAQDPAYIQVQSLQYNGNATAKVRKLTYKYTNNDDVFLFVNIPFYDVSNFSSLSPFYFVENSRAELAIAYFNLLNNNKTINTEYKQGLSFGDIDNPLSYQKNLLQTYWRNFGNILADPVKVKCIAHFPKSVFLSLTPLTPVYIKTKETTNLYYINKITGYKGSHLPCEVELIKL